MQRRWTVMTWNLQGSTGLPVNRVATIIEEHSPDVLVAQEIRRHQASRLAKRLGWKVSWHRKHHPYTPLVWWRSEGMALFTPHRLSDTSSTTLTLGVSTWTYKHRIVVQGLVQRDDASGHRVFDVHLASDADGGAERLEQARTVADLVRASGPAPVIVAGDLNDADDTEVVAILCGDERIDAWTSATERSAGTGDTNPSHAPVQRLDHVLVPKESTIVDASVPAGGVDWAAISDHLPVVATFDSLWADGDFQMRSQ